ncbi:hypothetical protein U9M48_005900 [Paspalum notatum var. saurae]|uniref:Uncharacterized protein n=1 Tax=Paspalum notatum var. saurae TaxID=547442 RepID=A0AAQ3SFR9_PASNO
MADTQKFSSPGRLVVALKTMHITNQSVPRSAHDKKPTDEVQVTRDFIQAHRKGDVWMRSVPTGPAAEDEPGWAHELVRAPPLLAPSLSLSAACTLASLTLTLPLPFLADLRRQIDCGYCPLPPATRESSAPATGARSNGNGSFSSLQICLLLFHSLLSPSHSHFAVIFARRQTGHLVMVKAVLSSISINIMLAMDLPKWVIKAIDKKKKNANGGNCLFSWDIVQRPIQFGGLGILNLGLVGWALRIRWLWLQKTDSSRPWEGLPLQVPQNAKALFDVAAISLVGNGQSIKFWTDRWLQGRTIAEWAPNLIKLIPRRARKQRTVAQGLTNRRWVNNIRGALSVQVLIEYLQLWNLVDGFELQQDIPDQYRLGLLALAPQMRPLTSPDGGVKPSRSPSCFLSSSLLTTIDRRLPGDDRRYQLRSQDRAKRQITAPFDIVIKGFGKHSMHSTLINFLARNKSNGKDRGVNNLNSSSYWAHMPFTAHFYFSLKCGPHKSPYS